MTDIDKFIEDTRDAIFDNGHAVSFGDQRSRLNRNLPWAHTIGRGVFERPELLIIGPFTDKQLQEMLDELVRIDNETPLEPMMIVEACGRRFRALPAARDALVAAMAVVGAFEALQMVWADPETGDFPGEPQALRPNGVHPLFPTSDPYGSPEDPFHDEEMK